MENQFRFPITHITKGMTCWFFLASLVASFKIYNCWISQYSAPSNSNDYMSANCSTRSPVANVFIAFSISTETFKNVIKQFKLPDLYSYSLESYLQSRHALFSGRPLYLEAPNHSDSPLPLAMITGTKSI